MKQVPSDFIENEKIYHCLNEFFDLAYALLKQKNTEPLINNQTYSFIKFESLDFYIKNSKTTIDANYNWVQENKEKNKMWDHHDHYFFKDNDTLITFIDYFKASQNVFIKALNNMLTFLKNPENQLIMHMNCAKKVTLTDNEAEFLAQKNIIINEKIRNTHEAYVLEQKLNNPVSSSTKLKL